MRLEFPNAERAAVDLGRVVTLVGSDKSCDVVLPSPGVASRHARFERSAQALYVCPCSEQAACVLNGRTLYQRAPLQVGDCLRLGSVECRVRAVAGENEVRPRGSADEQAVSSVEATRVRAVLPGLVLRGLSGPTLGHGFAVRDGMLLGRQNDCHVCIETLNVSRHHARVHVSPDGVEVEDLGSANGTFINGKRVQRAPLRPGDKLCLDQVCFTLLEPGATASATLRTQSRSWLTYLIGGVIVVLAVIAVMLLVQLRS